jgi:hypothetical protein
MCVIAMIRVHHSQAHKPVVAETVSSHRPNLSFAAHDGAHTSSHTNTSRCVCVRTLPLNTRCPTSGVSGNAVNYAHTYVVTHTYTRVTLHHAHVEERRQCSQVLEQLAYNDGVTSHFCLYHTSHTALQTHNPPPLHPLSIPLNSGNWSVESSRQLAMPVSTPSARGTCASSTAARRGGRNSSRRLTLRSVPGDACQRTRNRTRRFTSHLSTPATTARRTRRPRSDRCALATTAKTRRATIVLCLCA